jgi:hypothetical protein
LLIATSDILVLALERFGAHALRLVGVMGVEHPAAFEVHAGEHQPGFWCATAQTAGPGTRTLPP